MGKKDNSSAGGGGGGKDDSKALAVQLDSQGKVKYDLLARQGHSKDKVNTSCAAVSLLHLVRNNDIMKCKHLFENCHFQVECNLLTIFR